MVSYVQHLKCSPDLFAAKLETYNRISSKLKLGTIGDDFSEKTNQTLKAQHNVSETEATATLKTSEFAR